MKVSKNPQGLIRIFIFGSLVLLLLFLLTGALILSTAFLKKENERSHISIVQLEGLFESQSRQLTEEVWTHSYESVSERVKRIAAAFGNGDYEMALVDTNGDCFYNPKTLTGEATPCLLPVGLSDDFTKLKSINTNSPVTNFDEKLHRYIYMAPLDVGAIRKGYILVSLSDPYGFYRGNSFLLTLRLFSPAIGGIILLWFGWLFFSRRFILRRLVDLEKNQALFELAAQLAHDIRSPLEAVKSVVDKPVGLIEHKQIILRKAYSRIENIKDDLLKKYKDPDAKNEEFAFALTVIESIIAEKYAGLGEETKIKINLETHVIDLAVGVKLPTVDFSRVLSNILSNSIEALKDTKEGIIKVSVNEGFNKILIKVMDNGPGIPEETLNEIRTSGGTHGKQDGFGMGLRHAKSTVAQAQGQFSIDSKLGNGTTVNLELPVAQRPEWVANKIEVDKEKKIIVLDDDESVRLLWQDRLQGYDVVCLADPEEFDIGLYPPSSCLYLLDHESIRSKVRGIDLITSHGLAKQAILVTSHFNDPKLQESVIRVGTKILPKFMISQVPVVKIEKLLDTHNVIHNPDLVLIDDESLNHMMWNEGADECGVSLLSLLAEDDLSKYNVAFDAPIFIDKKLENDISGYDVGKRLYDSGFKNLYLCTSGPLSALKVPEFFKEVVGKDFPFHMFRKKEQTKSIS